MKKGRKSETCPPTTMICGRSIFVPVSAKISWSLFIVGMRDSPTPMIFAEGSAKRSRDEKKNLRDGSYEAKM
jgi:hypothetical protein